jgi:hypothetical protein
MMQLGATGFKESLRFVNLGEGRLVGGLEELIDVGDEAAVDGGSVGCLRTTTN